MHLDGADPERPAPFLSAPAISFVDNINRADNMLGQKDGGRCGTIPPPARCGRRRTIRPTGIASHGGYLR